MGDNTTTLRQVIADHQIDIQLYNVVRLCKKYHIPIDIKPIGGRRNRNTIMQHDEVFIVNHYNRLNRVGKPLTDNQL